MNVLITNSRLDGYGGSQAFVRDLGRALQRAGHEVVAYSSDPGNVDTLTEAGMIPTCNDLKSLPFKPDIIHAQHHLDAMTAILGLPELPAVYHCHGAVWRECAPRHPRIYHYLAMSRTLGERMMVESAIPPERLSTLLNTVDLQRFTTVRSAAPRLTRALFYNKIHHPNGSTLTAIRRVCERLGITLDCNGQKFGTHIAHPEAVLPTYDLVFASGKSAIDALACGCAVVVLGRTSCGTLVMPDNYQRLREVNFSIAVNSPPPSEAAIAAGLQRYTASGCAEVTTRLRHDASHDRSMQGLTKIYEQVIQQHQTQRPSAEEERLAALNYLRKIVPLVRGTDLALSLEPKPTIS
jgi:hypothetical protein